MHSELLYTSGQNIAHILPGALLVITLVLRQWLRRRKHIGRHFPPGPKPRFLFGNFFDLPMANSAEIYVEWGRKYQSNILHATCFGTHYVVLNSLVDAETLLQGRASTYSDRPAYTTVDETGWVNNMGFMGYGETWRKHRRLAQQSLRKDAASTYHPTQLIKTHQMLRGVLCTPERFAAHNKALSLGIAMSTMYGYDLVENDPYIAQTEEATLTALILMQPGYTIVNSFPFLKYIPAWFPMASSQRMIRNTRRLIDMLMTIPTETVKKQLENGTAKPSVVSRFLSEKGNITKEDEQDISRLAFAIYTGGSDTTVSATSTFLYLMVTHPEIQARAQEEIDRVVGVDRLPTFDDRPLLPYIEAIYREVLRWQPPAPMGAPHQTTVDDTLHGYMIPEGTVILANIWAMTRDESLYPDAMSFKPERFIDSNGELTDDDRIISFGFGRRVCVGQHVASATLWITFVSMLATFHMSKAEGKDGTLVEVGGEFTNESIVVHKKPFKCSILPRSDGARKLIEETLEQDDLLCAEI